MKKGLAVLVCVLALAALCVPSAQAATAWTPLTNYSVGLTFGQYFIVDNTVTPVGSAYWYLDPTNSKALLATALTAKSSGATLSAFLDPAAPGSICWGVEN